MRHLTQFLECPVLSAPVNGDISCTGEVPGSVCTATCDPDHVLIGAQTITCTSHVKWDFPVPSCSEGMCMDISPSYRPIQYATFVWENDQI